MIRMLLPSGSRKENIGGAGPPKRMISASVSTPSARRLAWRFGRDPAWRHWRPWLLASAAATGVILIAYATDVTGPAAAILQRAAVTVPQAAVAAIAARLTWRNTDPADIDAAIGASRTH